MEVKAGENLGRECGVIKGIEPRQQNGEMKGV